MGDIEIAPNGVPIRVEARSHQVRERAASRQRKELRPGRLRARGRHQEPPRLKEGQPGLIAHPLQHLGVKPVSARRQRLVRRHTDRHAANEAQKPARRFSAAKCLQPAQRRLGPGREILTEQRQIKQPLARIIQELETPALRSQRPQKSFTRHIDIKGKQRYRRCPCRPSWWVGCKRGDVRCNVKSGDAGCRRGRDGDVQPPATKPIRHCRQRRPAGREGQQVGGERGEQRGLARPCQAGDADADRGATFQHVSGETGGAPDCGYHSVRPKVVCMLKSSNPDVLPITWSTNYR